MQHLLPPHACRARCRSNNGPRD